uniref:MYC-associated zinc finger protein a (purine-binding transcription factor) n=1 Tax=Hucho hucho TaxID=62062 RepID=A0A4W5PGB3_9TELE
MKDRAAREREDGSKGRGLQTIPLSLLHLSLPSHPPLAESLPQPSPLGNQEGQPVAVSIAPATVTMAAPQVLQAVRKNHACEACGKAFRDVYHLNRHRLSHSDEKPYHCPICQQRFKRKDRMSYHVRSHQGGVEKPYVCPHCAKGFSRPDHLNSHVRQVHSTERPFKCTTCTSAFATRDRLRAHLIRHEEKVPCHICGKLLSAAYITDHMRVHNQSQHHACHLCNRSEWTFIPSSSLAGTGTMAVAVSLSGSSTQPGPLEGGGEGMEVEGCRGDCSQDRCERSRCGSGVKFPVSTDVGSAFPTQF